MDRERVRAILRDMEMGIAEIRQELGLAGGEEAYFEVVGGVATERFPDCCAVGTAKGWTCSGTLVAPTVVITAGHCEGVTRVFVGGQDILEPHQGQTIAVSGQFNHDTADLRVLVLAEPVQGISPRHIAQGAEIGEPAFGIVAGFGSTTTDGKYGYGIKRMAEVPIMSLACKGDVDPSYYGCRAGSELVAGHLGLATDTCRGDSGGPLYIAAPGGEYHLLGATSRATNKRHNMCGDGGVYVRVDQFVDWIREVSQVAIGGPRM